MNMIMDGTQLCDVIMIVRDGYYVMESSTNTVMEKVTNKLMSIIRILYICLLAPLIIVWFLIIDL